MKFKFETGEIIEVNDISLANVLRSDKRYKELNGDEEINETLPVNEDLEREIETLKAEKEELEKALEKANEVPKNAKELKAINVELTTKNEDLEKEIEELKIQLEKFNEIPEPEKEPENGEE